MGWFTPEPQYQPTARDRYNEKKAREREAARQRQADRREALRIQQQTLKEERAAAERRRRELEAAEAEADKQAAATEKEILTRPIRRKRGATRNNPNIIFVWHRGAEPPTDLQVKQHRKGLGVVCGLQPGGGIAPEHAMLAALREKWLAQHGEQFDTAFPDYAAALRASFRDVLETYPILGHLRDDDRMADLFGVAEINMEQTETQRMEGTYGVYDRKVVYTIVPELIDVVIGNAGLELTYRRRDGESPKLWTKNLDVLKGELARLGVDSHRLTVDTDRDHNIVLRFNDRDPLSDPMPQVIHPYDAEKGRSYLGRAADGSDIYLGIKNNASW